MDGKEISTACSEVLPFTPRSKVSTSGPAEGANTREPTIIEELEKNNRALVARLSLADKLLDDCWYILSNGYTIVPSSDLTAEVRAYRESGCAHDGAVFGASDGHNYCLKCDVRVS